MKRKKRSFTLEFYAQRFFQNVKRTFFYRKECEIEILELKEHSRIQR